MLVLSALCGMAALGGLIGFIKGLSGVNDPLATGTANIVFNGVFAAGAGYLSFVTWEKYRAKLTHCVNGHKLMPTEVECPICGAARR